jgi:hypothetical protein
MIAAPGWVHRTVTTDRETSKVPAGAPWLHEITHDHAHDPSNTPIQLGGLEFIGLRPCTNAPINDSDPGGEVNPFAVYALHGKLQSESARTLGVSVMTLGRSRKADEGEVCLVSAPGRQSLQFSTAVSAPQRALHHCPERPRGRYWPCNNRESGEHQCNRC